MDECRGASVAAPKSGMRLPHCKSCRPMVTLHFLPGGFLWGNQERTGMSALRFFYASKHVTGLEPVDHGVLLEPLVVCLGVIQCVMQPAAFFPEQGAVHDERGYGGQVS